MLLKINEVAERLGLTYRTIYQYCFRCQNCRAWFGKDTQNPCHCNNPIRLFTPVNIGQSQYRFGPDWRIEEKQLNQFLEERRYHYATSQER